MVESRAESVKHLLMEASVSEPDLRGELTAPGAGITLLGLAVERGGAERQV